MVKESSYLEQSIKRNIATRRKPAANPTSTGFRALNASMFGLPTSLGRLHDALA
jgi:hypothetical protein